MVQKSRQMNYWRFPMSIVLAFVIAIGLQILNSYYPNPRLFLIATQLRMMTGAILLAQGLAIVWFVSDYYRVHPVMKWVIFLFAAFTDFSFLIILLGAADSRYDIRQLIVK